MLTFSEIIEIIDRQEESNILIAALDLEVFTILDKNSMTAKNLARKAGTILEGTEPLLNALASMGALRKKGIFFSNTSESYKHLCAHSKEYKKGILMLKLDSQGEWTKLIKTIRNGRNLTEYEDDNENPEFRRLFTYAMHERSAKFVRPISEFITRQPVGRLLDLGAGPGSYSTAILKKDKKARAVLLDRPTALKVAKEIVKRMKLSSRVDFLAGDLFKTKYGAGYQTVLFSQILHIYNVQQNKTLFRKIQKAINPGGRIVICDLFLEENRLKPYDAVLFSLTMLLYTARGMTYSFKETEELLRDTGFHKFKRVKLGQGNSLIEAVRI
tara:strand:+ start:78 stop:1061 length:984 start_codon:yes stop_codon:yes gene_type:complete